jgi:serine/threonine-protein kinase
MGLACARSGRDAEAMAALRRCGEVLGRTPMVLSALATAHALAGRPNDARTLLAEFEGMAAHRYVGPYFPAQVQVALGEHDAALTGLEAALEERVHWLAAIHLDPSLAALRGHPRFEAVVARVRSRANNPR